MFVAKYGLHNDIYNVWRIYIENLSIGVNSLRISTTDLKPP